MSPARSVELKIPPPVAGVNLAVGIDKLQPHEALNLRGFEFDEYATMGVPRAPKSLGTIVAGQKILSAHMFQRASGATQLIIHLDDGSLRYSTDFLTTSGSATWTTIATGLSTTLPFHYITWLSAVWMGNGTNDFRKWDGTTQTTYPTAPKGAFLALWRDTLWMSGDTTNADRVYQCAPGDPTVWPALNFVDIEKGAGRGITGLTSVESSLVVCKLLTTHIIFDPVEYTNRTIDRGKGCLSHSSIVSHGGSVYFVSHLGVCRFLGDGPSELVSDKIAPIFDDLYVFGTSLGAQVFDTARETHIWGFSFENFVGWYIPSNSFSQYIKYFPSLPEKPWLFGTPTEVPSANKSVAVSVREPGEYAELYRIGGSPAIIVREYGGAIDDAIACEWGSAWFDFDQPTQEKYVDMVQILHRGPLDIRIKRNYDDDEFREVATGLDHGQPELHESTVFTDEYARSIQLYITSTTNPGERKQIVGSGLSGVASITRFQAAIAAVVVTAQMLGTMRR